MPDEVPTPWERVSRVVRTLERRLNFLSQNTIEESLHRPKSLEVVFNELQQQVSLYQVAVGIIRDELTMDQRWKPLGNVLGEQIKIHLPIVQQHLGVDLSGTIRGDQPNESECETRLQAAGKAIGTLAEIIRGEARDRGLFAEAT